MSERTVTDSVPGHMETRPKLIRLSSRRSIPSAKKATGGGPIRPTRVLPAARAKLQRAAQTIGSTSVGSPKRHQRPCNFLQTQVWS